MEKLDAKVQLKQNIGIKFSVIVGVELHSIFKRIVSNSKAVVLPELQICRKLFSVELQKSLQNLRENMSQAPREVKK